jgi:DNA repair protein RecO (recombination protein O)
MSSSAFFSGGLLMAEKALALVVRGTDWSETSRITTLFTREHGKVRALAKGGRRLRSSFEGALDLLSVCHVVYLRKGHGGLDLLTEAQVAERFPGLRSQLPALNAAYYVAELLADGTQEYDPHPDLFDAALRAIRHFSQHFEPFEAIAGFELVWLRELGYSPTLDACVVCARSHAEPTPNLPERLGFSPTAGGVVCDACYAGVPDKRPLSTEAWQALRSLTRAASETRVVTTPWPKIVRAELRAILGLTVSSVLGRRPRLLNYLDPA